MAKISTRSAITVVAGTEKIPADQGGTTKYLTVDQITTSTKADASVADAISKKHTQNSDTILDEGGANETAVADIRTAVNNFDTAGDGKLKPSGLQDQTLTVVSTVSPTPSYLGQYGIDANGRQYIATALTGTKWTVVNDEVVYSYSRASIVVDGTDVTVGNGYVYTMFRNGTLKMLNHSSDTYSLASGGFLVHNKTTNTLIVRTSSQLAWDDAVLLIYDGSLLTIVGGLWYPLVTGPRSQAVYTYTRATVTITGTDVTIGSGYIYILYRDGTLKSFNHSEDTYTLASGGRLVYNRASNTLVVRTNAQLSADDAVLFVYDGVKGFTTGLLYAQWKTDQLDTKIDGIGSDSLSEDVSSELKEVVSDTKDVQIDNETLSFGFITDIHAPDESSVGLTHTRWFSNLAKYRVCDFLVNGGDIHWYSSSVDRAAAIAAMDRNAYALSNAADKVISLHGNHDDNGTGVTEANYITSDEFYTRYNRLYDRDNFALTKPSRTSLYFYIDFEDTNIRVIALDTSESDVDNQSQIGITDTQLNWLANTALDFTDKDTPSDWGVVLLSHVCLRLDVGGWASYPDSNNFDIAIGIFEAFIGGSHYNEDGGSGYYAYDVDKDFTSQGAMEVIASFHGHCHYDNYYKPAGQWMMVMIGSTAHNAPAEEIIGILGDPQLYTRTAGEITEALFDVITIDRTAGKIYCKRFGAGVDREITY